MSVERSDMVAEQQREAGVWPSLRVEDWTPTRDTLHMWTQIVGKIRLAHAPMLNHWWQVPLYVSPRGLTTSAIPCGTRTFDLEFDFHTHRLDIRTSDGNIRSISLEPMTVADFHAQVFRMLGDLGIETTIQSKPNEVDPAIPFAEDTVHASYDPAAAHLFWRQLVQADRLMTRFRSSYIGKDSPVHFFWGAMDLAYTRFSGRSAPTHPGGAPNCADWVMEEGYSHQLSSCGFWPGGGDEGAFYAYTYPDPNGFAAQSIAPEGAFHSTEFGEFLLPYEAVRRSANPDRMVLEFFRSTYEAAAETGLWDRHSLETDPGRWDHYR